MPRLRTLPVAGCIAAAALLTGCGTASVKPASTHHRAPESTTPSAEASAGVSPQTAYSRTPRLKPSSTWNSASLPTNFPSQDGPPHPNEIPPEIAAIPDAVPQFEMRSEFGNPDSYEVYGKKYVVLEDATGYKERGRASWYGKKFHGKKTSSGEPYDMFSMTGAHKTLPIPCYARVTNLDTGASVVIKINDRGPFHDGRVVDVSYAAAVKLDMLGHGSIPVEIEVVTPMIRPSHPTMMANASPRPQAVMTAASGAPEAPAAPPPSLPKPPPAPPLSVSPAATVAVAAPAPQLATHIDGPRFLQAGLFSDPVNAVSLRDQLTSLGVGIDSENVLLRSEDHSGSFSYRVLVGPFKDAISLDTMRTRLAAANLVSVPVDE
jgi:rare lipoprotein A